MPFILLNKEHRTLLLAFIGADRLQRAHGVEKALIDWNLHHELPDGLGDVGDAEVE